MAKTDKPSVAPVKVQSNRKALPTGLKVFGRIQPTATAGPSTTTQPKESTKVNSKEGSAKNEKPMEQPGSDAEVNANAVRNAKKRDRKKRRKLALQAGTDGAAATEEPEQPDGAANSDDSESDDGLDPSDKKEASVDEIFEQLAALKKKKKAEDALKAAETARKMSMAAGGGDDDGFGDSRGSKRRSKTEEGYPIYSADELKIGQGGGTPLCPFDCDCCF